MILNVLLTIACLVFFNTLEASILVGIAGGTGSGKTTLAEQLKEHFENNSVLIQQDCYYKDLSHLPMEVRENTNFDHPDSLDFALLKQHLIDLQNNKPITKPKYDFHTHSRESSCETVVPQNIIIVEGILLFSEPEIRDLFDIKIYVETDDDIRILRRLERDIKDRGRHFESVKNQYITTVKPMHKKFVAPSKDYADIVIYGVNENFPLITKLISGYLENEILNN